MCWSCDCEALTAGVSLTVLSVAPGAPGSGSSVVGLGSEAEALVSAPAVTL